MKFLTQALCNSMHSILVISNYEFRYRSNNLSLKYQRYTLSGCKEIGIRKFGFMAKNQFLCK